MKTTNIIIDYVIIGFILTVTILAYQYITDTHFLANYLSNITRIETTIFLLALYPIGIIFNQVSDCMIKVLQIIFKYTYHEKRDKYIMLQTIIIKSKEAFEYLSFRRTIIRIIRSCVSSGIILVLMYFLYIIIQIISGMLLVFSLERLMIILLYICLSICAYLQNNKLERGYYKAIENFYNCLVVGINEGEINDKC